MRRACCSPFSDRPFPERVACPKEGQLFLRGQKGKYDRVSSSCGTIPKRPNGSVETHWRRRFVGPFYARIFLAKRRSLRRKGWPRSPPPRRKNAKKAVKAISRSQGKDCSGADCGRSRDDPCRSGFRRGCAKTVIGSGASLLFEACASPGEKKSEQP